MVRKLFVAVAAVAVLALPAAPAGAEPCYPGPVEEILEAIERSTGIKWQECE